MGRLAARSDKVAAASFFAVCFAVMPFDLLSIPSAQQHPLPVRPAHPLAPTSPGKSRAPRVAAQGRILQHPLAPALRSIPHGCRGPWHGGDIGELNVGTLFRGGRHRASSVSLRLAVISLTCFIQRKPDPGSVGHADPIKAAMSCRLKSILSLIPAGPSPGPFPLAVHRGLIPPPFAH